jgi:hypothetical protein
MGARLASWLADVRMTSGASDDDREMLACSSFSHATYVLQHVVCCIDMSSII